jgi:hypothetical protein
MPIKYFRRANWRARRSARPVRDEHSGGAGGDDEGLSARKKRIRKCSQLEVDQRKLMITKSLIVQLLSP